MYVKKDNGGVHTARNEGIRRARGAMIANIDSDDELLPNALEILVEAWESIPEKDYYREVCARCQDEEGRAIGSQFPDNINDLSFENARKAAKQCKGEHFGFWRADIMKKNPWPEPEGIKFVNEGILWSRLEKRYRSFYINDIVRVYHTEDNASYSRAKESSIQIIKNHAWNYSYVINHHDIFELSFKDYMKELMGYAVWHHILRKHHVSNRWPLVGIKNKLLLAMVFVPAIPIARMYEKKKKIV